MCSPWADLALPLRGTVIQPRAAELDFYRAGKARHDERDRGTLTHYCYQLPKLFLSRSQARCACSWSGRSLNGALALIIHGGVGQAFQPARVTRSPAIGKADKNVYPT